MTAFITIIFLLLVVAVRIWAGVAYVRYMQAHPERENAMQRRHRVFSHYYY